MLIPKTYAKFPDRPTAVKAFASLAEALVRQYELRCPDPTAEQYKYILEKLTNLPKNAVSIDLTYGFVDCVIYALRHHPKPSEISENLLAQFVANKHEHDTDDDY